MPLTRGDRWGAALAGVAAGILTFVAILLAANEMGFAQVRDDGGAGKFYVFFALVAFVVGASTHAFALRLLGRR